MRMSHQIGNINKKTNIIIKILSENSGVKKYNEWNKPSEGLNNIL